MRPAQALALGAAVAVAVAALAAQAQGAPVLPTGKMTIGTWCGVPRKFLSPERFLEAREAGFTYISTSCEGRAWDAIPTVEPVYAVQMVKLAHAAGLQSIVWDSRIFAAAAGRDVDKNLDAAVANYSKLPGLLSYFVNDEPPESQWSRLVPAFQGLLKRDPAHFPYINLSPGHDSWGAHVERFVKMFKPQVWSFDQYPLMSDGSDDPSFYTLLDSARMATAATNVPWWQYVQAIGYNWHRTPTGPELLWQMMHVLAYGGSGVLYFTYWTPSVEWTGELFTTALIDRDGRRTVLYNATKLNNRRIAGIGKYTVAATSLGVFLNGPLMPYTEPFVPFSQVYVAGPNPLTIGMFGIPGSQATYALLVNRNHKAASSNILYLAVPSGSFPEVLSVETDKFVPMNVLGQVSPGIVKVQLNLEPGDGALLYLPGPAPRGYAGPEAYVGIVRGDRGSVSVVDTTWGVGQIGEGWWNNCPEGYRRAGTLMDPNGFYVCLRRDISHHKVFLGNVVNDRGILYSVSDGGVSVVPGGTWDQCPSGTRLIGHLRQNNGFFLCYM